MIWSSCKKKIGVDLKIQSTQMLRNISKWPWKKWRSISNKSAWRQHYRTSSNVSWQNLWKLTQFQLNKSQEKVEYSPCSPLKLSLRCSRESLEPQQSGGTSPTSKEGNSSCLPRSTMQTLCRGWQAKHLWAKVMPVLVFPMAALPGIIVWRLSMLLLLPRESVYLIDLFSSLI